MINFGLFGVPGTVKLPELMLKSGSGLLIVNLSPSPKNSGLIELIYPL